MSQDNPRAKWFVVVVEYSSGELAASDIAEAIETGVPEGTVTVHEMDEHAARLVLRRRADV